MMDVHTPFAPPLSSPYSTTRFARGGSESGEHGPGGTMMP